MLCGCGIRPASALTHSREPDRSCSPLSGESEEQNKELPLVRCVDKPALALDVLVLVQTLVPGQEVVLLAPQLVPCACFSNDTA